MEEHSNFSNAIEFWRGVGLPTLQRQLDQQGLSIVENQKDGLMSRKKLAEQTRGMMHNNHPEIKIVLSTTYQV